MLAPIRNPKSKIRTPNFKIRNPKSKIRNGFTLIELLVVIAIISLLVSILLPSLNRAKDLARSVLCMTNLKAQGTSNYLWGQENDNQMPGYIFHDRISGSPPTENAFLWNHYYFGGEFSSGIGGGSWFFESWSQKIPPKNPLPIASTWAKFTNWMDIAAETSGSYDVARCPAQETWSSTGASPDEYKWSYSMNYWLGPASGKFNTYEDAKQPAENVYIKDRGLSLTIQTYHYDESTLGPPYGGVDSQDWISKFGGDRHNEKCNFLFADGHADSEPIGSPTFTDKDRWTKYRRTCQIFGYDW